LCIRLQQMEPEHNNNYGFPGQGHSMHRIPCTLFILLVLLSIPAASAAPTVTFTRNGTDLVGLCFGPYLNGEQPGATTLTEPVIRQRLMAVRSDTTWVRTFGVDGGLERVGPVAHELGMKAAVGAWISGTAETDQKTIDRLIAIGKNHDADILVVGNEVLLNKKIPESTLIAYLQEVRAEVPDIPVGTADIYGEIRDHPDVVGASDILLVNIYPYWEGVPVGDAPEHTLGAYDTVVGIAGGRPVVISELGWPDAGNPFGRAVPGNGNASRYLHEVTAALHARAIPYFYFSAFDEAWKTDENGVGPHWGSGMVTSPSSPAASRFPVPIPPVSSGPVNGSWTTAVTVRLTAGSTSAFQPIRP
jgi:exo-beta-1,3-glucanase (GH17 family)